MVKTGIFRRASGGVGFFSGVFGAAGWKDDAEAWLGWAAVNPELAGAFVGGGTVMVVTWIVLEIAAWRNRKTAKSSPASPMATQSVTINVGDQKQQRALPAPSGVTGTVSEYIPNRNVVRINTRAGPMEIRTWYDGHAWQDERMVEDVLRILDRNGVLRPLGSQK